jgi:type I restriction enzyme, S subunit
MDDWTELSLGQTGLVVTGKTPSKDNPEDWGFEMPFVTPSDYGSYRKKAYGSSRMLSVIGLRRLSGKILPQHSVMVTCIGSDMGKVAMNAIPVIANQQINAIVPNKAVVDPDFLYYQLVNMHEILRAYGGDGTAVPIVNKGDFSNIKAKFPEPVEQKVIAEILSSLDDKIDLLHRQNKTLESLAETLFRHWFIDGAQDGWERKGLLEVVELVGGGTPKTSNIDYWEGDIPWLSGGDIAAAHKSFVASSIKAISTDGLQNSSAKLLPQFATVISARGTVGKYCMLAKPMTYSQSNYGILPRDNHSFCFSYLLINHVVDELQSAAYGSVFDTITTTTFADIKLKLPNTATISDFETKISPYFQKKLECINQIAVLERVRDTLLPKLMSGEIRVEYQEAS